MKKLRKTKPYIFPAGTLGSLKGDDLACLRYLEKRGRSTRRARRYQRWWQKRLMKILVDGDE